MTDSFRNPLQKYAKNPKPMVYSVLLIYRHVQNRPHPFQFVQNLFTMFKNLILGSGPDTKFSGLTLAYEKVFRFQYFR